ncbi:MAG: GDP-mannose 4,6-dehydratase [Rhodocyclaceae bacterium]|jgi:GDPmannose 4,6-dehydratase|nr:GDP-mannose 4,6-dehydratase [Rhodocyclaceae bacterium]
MCSAAVSRRALICGVSGQDGAYLAQILLAKGYEVWGTSRDAQKTALQGLKSLGILEQVRILSMSPADFRSVLQVISTVQPQEIYNLAGQSSVGLSFGQPRETVESIVIGTLNLLEAIRSVDPAIRFFNAGSSECFGDIAGGLAADENTPFRPRSPYAVAKAAATWQVAVHRESYALFACTGILFNHESPLRPERFVTRKIVTAAYRIAHGSKEKLTLGNINIHRDWGWAPDYVVAMWKMLNRDTPEDFVIATAQTQSLQGFVETVFDEAGLDWQEHVITDPSMLRPSDPIVSRGNPGKARALLEWQPIVYGQEVPRKMYYEESIVNQTDVGQQHV